MAVSRELSMRRTKVAIVGFSDAVKRQAPYDDPLWEVWGFNHAHRLGFMLDKKGTFRADRWFDLHQLAHQPTDDLEWMRICPITIYLTEPYLEAANGIVYPLEAVLEKYGPYGGDYFASSFAYAIALAML